MYRQLLKLATWSQRRRRHSWRCRWKHDFGRWVVSGDFVHPPLLGNQVQACRRCGLLPGLEGTEKTFFFAPVPGCFSDAHKELRRREAEEIQQQLIAESSEYDLEEFEEIAALN